MKTCLPSSSLQSSAGHLLKAVTRSGENAGRCHVAYHHSNTVLPGEGAEGSWLVARQSRALRIFVPVPPLAATRSGNPLETMCFDFL